MDDRTQRVDPETLRVDGTSEPTIGVAGKPEPFTGPGRLGPYRILEELGRGGMGVVYLAEDEELGRRVALKVLPLGFAHGEARARFHREAMTASRLDHPNLCGVLSVGATGGQPWIAMRYVPGRTLAHELEVARSARGSTVSVRDANSRIPPDRADWRASVRLVLTLARAVEAAHRVGIVHRDLKPGNVMVTPEGVPVILDFGLAIDLTGEDGPGITQSGDVLGTPHYMAPEQIRGQSHRADARTDVWALGVILHEALTGHRPFEAPTRDALYRLILEKDPPPVRKSAAVPRDLETVVATALEKSADRRYDSAQALADDLAACLDIRPIRARPVGIAGRLLRFALRRPALTALVCVLLVGIPSLLWMSTSALRAHGRLLEQAQRVEAKVIEALASEDPMGARAALSEREALGLVGPELERLRLRCDQALLLDEGSALALDRDTDPRGTLAASRLERLATSPDLAVDAAAWRAWIEKREGRPEQGRSLLMALDRSDAASIARVLFDDAPPTGVREEIFAALALGARERPRDALRRFEALLELRPNAVALAWIAAEQATKFQDYHAALAHAGRARAMVAELSPARLGRYSVHLRRAGHVERALEFARTAAARRPNDPILEMHLATALSDAKRNDEALVLYQRILERDEPPPMAFVAYSTELFERKEFENALAAASRASEQTPSLPEAHYARGAALMELLRDEEAVIALERAVALRSDFDYALNALGSCYRNLGRFADARRVFRDLLARRPTDASAHTNHAFVLWAEGDAEGALAAFERAKVLDPSEVVNWVKIGTLQHASGRDREAEEAYRQALRLEPKDEEALTNLALIRAAAGDGAEARTLAQAAVDASPDDVVALRNLASLHLDRGAIPDAVALMLRAHAVDPNSAEVLVALSVVLVESDPVSALAAGLELERRGSPHAALWTPVRGAAFAKAGTLANGRRLVDAVEAKRLSGGSRLERDEALDLLEDLRRQRDQVAKGTPGSTAGLQWRATMGWMLEVAAALDRPPDEWSDVRTAVAEHDSAAAALSHRANRRKVADRRAERRSGT